MRGPYIAIGAVCLIAVGCTLPMTFDAVRKELASRPANLLPPARAGLSRFKGVIHVHTYRSHDSQGTDDEIVKSAEAANLDFVMMTEHAGAEAFAGYRVSSSSKVQLIPGAEYRCDDQYVLAVGLDRPIEDGRRHCADVAAAIEKFGGVPIGAHPVNFSSWDIPTLSGIEVWDLYDEARAARWSLIAKFLDVLLWYGHYSDEIIARIIRRPDAALARYDEQTIRRRFTAIASPDAHQNVRVVRQLDPYSLAFRLVPTYVFAKDSSREELLDALRNGRTYFAFEVFKSAVGFDFVAFTDEGGFWGMGDEVPYGPGLFLTVFAPSRGRVTLLKNGHPFVQAETDQLAFYVDEPAVYRAEVELSVLDQWRPWIFSNPIYVH